MKVTTRVFGPENSRLVGRLQWQYCCNYASESHLPGGQKESLSCSAIRAHSLR